MKQMLIRLRQWLGLRQDEMESAIKTSRSQYSMAEPGTRTLAPEWTMLLVELYKEMEKAPLLPEFEEMEKTVISSRLPKEEKALGLLELNEAYIVEYVNPRDTLLYPERVFQRPVSGEDSPEKTTALDRIGYLADLATSRLKQYQSYQEKRLDEELELVRQRAVVEHLRKKLTTGEIRNWVLRMRNGEVTMARIVLLFSTQFSSMPYSTQNSEVPHFFIRNSFPNRTRI